MPGITDVLGGMQQAASATLRTGRVVGLSGATITVDLGGQQLTDLPYLESYLPILGDPVQILSQGAVSLVIGATTGMPADNVLKNGSFELDAPGTIPPSFWTYADGGGSGSATAKVDVATGWGPKDGAQWLEINHSSGTDSVTYVTSEAIPVNAGERWSASAYVVSTNDFGTDEPQLSVLLAWFADDSGAYPGDIISQDYVQVINGPTGPWWVPVRAVSGNGIPVPYGAGVLRVVIRSDLFGAAVYWDKVVCRRISTGEVVS